MIGFGLARNANSIIGWAASCFAQSVNVSSPQRPALRTKPVRRINGRHRLSLLVGWMFFLFQIRSGLAVNLIFFRSILPSPPGSFKCDAGDKNPCENNDANQYQRAVRCPFVECFNHPYIIQHPGDKSSLFPASAPHQISPRSSIPRPAYDYTPPIHKPLRAILRRFLLLAHIAILLELSCYIITIWLFSEFLKFPFDFAEICVNL